MANNHPDYPFTPPPSPVLRRVFSPTRPISPPAILRPAPSPPALPQPTPHQIPLLSLQARRSACTHTSMTRLYGAHRCQICHRTPNIGHIYQCTQDHGGYLPRPPPPSFRRFAATQDWAAMRIGMDKAGKKATVADLPPWIQKAIEQGEHTPEQVEILVQQRQRVFDSITKTDERYAALDFPSPAVSPHPQSSTRLTSTSSDGSIALPAAVMSSFIEGEQSSSTPTMNESEGQPGSGSQDTKGKAIDPTAASAQAATTPMVNQPAGKHWLLSVDRDRHLDPTTVLAHAGIAHTQERTGSQILTSQEISRLMGRQQPPPEAFRAFPNCNFRTCQQCRPSFASRTFPSIDDVIQQDVNEVPEWEWANRRVSDANVVCKIGLRASQPAATPYSDLGTVSSHNISSGHLSRPYSQYDTDSDDLAAEERPRHGFRDTIRNAIKNVIPLNSSSSSTSTSKGKATSRLSLRSRFSRHSKEYEEIDLGVRPKEAEDHHHNVDKAQAKEQERTLNEYRDFTSFTDACLTLLPASDARTEAESDGPVDEGEWQKFGAGEVEVDGGVAVTEEGVESRIPDIVTQF